MPLGAYLANLILPVPITPHHPFGRDLHLEWESHWRPGTDLFRLLGSVTVAEYRAAY